MFIDFMKEQQDRKEQLELMFPEPIIKGISLSLLKKIAHILDIPSFSSKSKRELMLAIISTQEKYEGKLDTVFFCEFENDVCKSLKLNVNCNFYEYMIVKEK